MNTTDPIPANQRRVDMGGLMRCCLATIAESEEPTEVGSILSCKYERDADNQNMIVNQAGVWEWNRPDA